MKPIFQEIAALGAAVAVVDREETAVVDAFYRQRVESR